MNKRSHNEHNTNTDALSDDGLAGLERRLERNHMLKQAMVQNTSTGGPDFLCPNPLTP
jgi:hypothetical protein